MKTTQLIFSEEICWETKKLPSPDPGLKTQTVYLCLYKGTILGSIKETPSTYLVHDYFPSTDAPMPLFSGNYKTLDEAKEKLIERSRGFIGLCKN